MKAILQESYGDPASVLRLSDVDLPNVAPDQVLVRVHASSVNASDCHRVSGSPLLVRLVEGFRRPRSPLLGTDAAGVVERVGKDVSGLAEGDEVFGVRSAAFAEFLSGKNFVLKPANLSFEEAATVPVAGQTALQALRDKGKLRTGQSVLVNGAGGGVGVFTVQIAKALGADVTAVTRTESVDLLRSLGADRVIDRASENFSQESTRYDLVVDVGGSPSLSQLRRVVAPGGRLVLVGAGAGAGGPVGRAAAGALRGITRPRILPLMSKPSIDDLTVLKEMLDSGAVRPVIDRTYPLEQVAEALGHLESGHPRGKIAITI